MKSIFISILLLLSTCLLAQKRYITGTVREERTGEALAGISISIKGTSTMTITDTRGQFRLQPGTVSFPLTLLVSGATHMAREIQLASPSENMEITLQPQEGMLNEVVMAASRVPERILRSPVSIEKMNLVAIRENPSLSYYDGLVNLKGMEAVTSSLTYKQVNTRGFNNTGNSRFLQLIDGVDNQTPGLNFAVGNQYGVSDIDLESVELIPGAASALYGPVAFNGVLMMRSKDPFKYQGLSLQAKAGVNHLNESAADPHGLYDISIRYAKAFNDKLAFKINAGYVSGLDWYATNYTDVSALTPPPNRGPSNPGRDALNIYGDEVSRTINGVGLVSRTGYEEKDLMNYDVYSLKLNGALHYRFNSNLEAIYQYNFGKGTASYTGSSRFDLNDFILQTHRLELRGQHFFVRAYSVAENSQNSYNTRSLGQFINRDWVRDLNGQVVASNLADNTWFQRYEAAFKGNVNGVPIGDHPSARAFADQGRFLPGTADFNTAKEKYIGINGLQGAGVLSRSKFHHVEGQYDLSHVAKFFDLLVGGNFRYYDMFTDGSLFDDKEKPVTIKEYGAFLQAAKSLLEDRLRLTASIRYDKNENFDGNVTPRFAAVYTAAKNHHFRASYQTGFRNPTPVDQFIKLNVGPITILGGAPDNSAGMNVYENSFTASSVGAFGAAFGAEVGSGTPFPVAVATHKDKLVKSNVPYIKPERQKAFEVGYKGLIGNSLMVDLNFYQSWYTDFILNTVVIRPESPVLAQDGTVNFQAAVDLLNGDAAAFQLYTNAADKVSAKGLSAGLTWMLKKGYTIGGNATWSSFDIQDANPNNIPAFNTPEFATNMTFGNSNAWKGFGFNIAWHWQDAFDWYGTFNGNRPGRIKAYSLVDLQLNKKLEKAKANIKIGASNLFNNQVSQAYGSPTIGAIYYVALTFDGLLQ